MLDEEEIKKIFQTKIAERLQEIQVHSIACRKDFSHKTVWLPFTNLKNPFTRQ